MPSLLRFVRAWLRPRPGDAEAVETTYERSGRALSATVYRPPGRAADGLPGWVVLHGLTWSGREHPSLVRFVRAVAAGGNVVLVPDIPEWRELRVAPAITVDTIRAAVRALHARGDADPARLGLFGFSFGATQALVASADPDVASRLHGIAAWGGYGDVHRLFRFGMTGEHELDGRVYRTRPDPYGCWIMAGNYLPHMRGFEDCADVAAAVHALALEAGRRRVAAWDPAFDASKARLRAGLPAAKHAIFDLLAPAAHAPPPADVERLRHLSGLLADAALRVDPLMDPAPFLPRLSVPVLFAHGRDDQLIPFTETVRLARNVPSDVLRRAVVTGLFAHSGGTRSGLGVRGLAREAVLFLDVLRHVLRLPVRD
jgi:pimeloyl-ACP methyl ester carboxylesterase